MLAIIHAAMLMNIAGPTETKNEPTLDSNIIGTKMFTFDSSMLDDYLQRSMQYWYGLREPQGVPVDLVRRCLCVANDFTMLRPIYSHQNFSSTCEYYEGCEWRTSKGEETLRKYKDQASKVTGSINTSKPV
jgi:exonuclease V